MIIEPVKIPRKFANICGAIREGESGSLEKLAAYDGFDHQKSAVEAEILYFQGNFEQALQKDMSICPFWEEWYYANVREEHVAAMAFVARLLGKEDDVIRFFQEQWAAIEADPDVEDHIKTDYLSYYEIHLAYLRTGIVPHFTEEETYQPVDDPTSLQQLIDEVKKENKKIDIESEKGQLKLFAKCCTKSSVSDMLSLYETIAENNLSTMWHIHALSAYNYLQNKEKAFEVILRMAKQRLWLVASATQVRPMELFTHPSAHMFLSDPQYLKEIVKAAVGK